VKKFLLLFIFFIIFYNVHSQSIGVGTGYSSDGDIPVNFNIQVKKIGGYISYINEKHSITSDMKDGDKWNQETTIGVSYEVFSDYPKVNILVGIGKNKTTNWYRYDYFPNELHSFNSYGTSYEAGFDIQLYKIISLTAIMNNYSGVKTMITLKYSFH